MTYVENNIGATSKSMLGETEGVPLMRTPGTNGCQEKRTFPYATPTFSGMSAP